MKLYRTQHGEAHSKEQDLNGSSETFARLMKFDCFFFYPVPA